MAPVGDSFTKRDEHREYFLESKGSRYLGLTTFQPSRADYLYAWQPQSPGALRASNRPVQRLLYFFLTLRNISIFKDSEVSSCEGFGTKLTIRPLAGEIAKVRVTF